jgi:hypothetical protein
MVSMGLRRNMVATVLALIAMASWATRQDFARADSVTRSGGDEAVEPPAFSEFPPIEDLWDVAIAPVTGVSLSQRNDVLEVLGGVDAPLRDGVSNYAMGPRSVTLWGSEEGIAGATEALAERGIKVDTTIRTDGDHYTFVPTTVTQNPVIPWAAGRRLFDTSGILQCTKGYSWYVPSGGSRWWYDSTAGHCAYAPWNTSTPVTLHGGYYYAADWPGVGFSQLMNAGSAACCPPSRVAYDISLYTVGGPQWARPSPISHLVGDYCPGTAGGCQYNYNGASFSVTATVGQNQIYPNSTYLTKSGGRTGTSTGIYRGVDGNGQGMIDGVSACGEYHNDSGAPVFVSNGNGTVTAVGMASMGNVDSGQVAPAYCDNSWTYRMYTFAFISTLTAATGAQVVTTAI